MNLNSCTFRNFNSKCKEPKSWVYLLRLSFTPKYKPKSGYKNGKKEKYQSCSSIEGKDTTTEEVSELPEGKIRERNIKEGHDIV